MYKMAKTASSDHGKYKGGWDTDFLLPLIALVGCLYLQD